MIKYMNAMEELGKTILEMLANGLGLSSNFFTRHMTERESAMLRANRYPPCPLPDRCLGLGSHSDPHTLTILLQDHIGGLQVRNDNKQWFGIRPLPNSFVVNIGDTLEVYIQNPTFIFSWLLKYQKIINVWLHKLLQTSQ